MTGEKINRFTHISQTNDDLMKKQELTRTLCHKSGRCIQRCMGMDALNGLSVVTKEIDEATGSQYHQRFLNYLKWFQENDLVGIAAN